MHSPTSEPWRVFVGAKRLLASPRSSLPLLSRVAVLAMLTLPPTSCSYAPDQSSTLAYFGMARDATYALETDLPIERGDNQSCHFPVLTTSQCAGPDATDSLRAGTTVVVTGARGFATPDWSSEFPIARVTSGEHAGLELALSRCLWPVSASSASDGPAPEYLIRSGD